MKLEPELIPCADRVKIYLKTMRGKNSITPEHPIPSTGIVDVAEKAKVKLKREDIYHIIHYLREQNEPIASCQQGYFYAITPEEMNGSIAEQVKIIKERQETLTLLKKIQANLFKATNSIFESPAGKVLKDNLELEKI